MNVGERIKQKRIELNMSQDELAKKVGYRSRSSIQKIEASRDLPLRKVSKMARALGCTESYLMGWEDNRIDPYYSSPDYYNSITDDEKYLIETYRDMSAKTKEAFIEYGEYLSQRDIQKG
jgi:transcriptional regulator with XRE-family HTH domain